MFNSMFDGEEIEFIATWPLKLWFSATQNTSCSLVSVKS
jgi:hypothetical protein